MRGSRQEPERRTRCRWRAVVAVIAALSLSLASLSAAAGGAVTFVREYVYKAGEGDSLISCRLIALEQVKRVLLEERGTYLESNTEVGNYSLSRENITVLTAGIVSTRIVDEQWDGATYRLKAELTADPYDVARKVDALRRDRTRIDELGAARKQYDEAHLALRAGKIDDAEGLLRQVSAGHPGTEYGAAAADQLGTIGEIRRYRIQSFDNSARAELIRHRTAIEVYFADWLEMPGPLQT